MTERSPDTPQAYTFLAEDLRMLRKETVVAPTENAARHRAVRELRLHHAMRVKAHDLKLLKVGPA